MSGDSMKQPLPAAVHALAAAGRGWHVFPVIAGTKRARWKDWASHATTDPTRIRSWAGWATPAGPPGPRGKGRARSGDNVGIACRPSGLVVLDLDQPKPDPTRDGETLPAPPEWQLPGVVDGSDVLAVLAERAGQPVPWDTHTVETRRGGRHLYFEAPVGRVVLNDSRGTHGWLLDVRAPGRPDSDGGYVLAAGSWVDADDNGPAGHYTTLDDQAAAALPAWLVDELAQPPAATLVIRAATADGKGSVIRQITDAVAAGTRRAGVRHPAAYAERALGEAINDVLRSVPGGRNDTLNGAAYSLGRLVADGLVPEHLAVNALTAAADVIGLGAAETAATIRSGLAAGTRRQHAT